MTGDDNGNDGHGIADNGDGESVDDVAMVLITVHVFKGDCGGDVGCGKGGSFFLRSEALSTGDACGIEAPEPHFYLLAPLRRPIDE